MAPRTPTLRVGLVGSRFAAQRHVEGWRRVYGVPVQLAGMTSLTRESREAFAAQHGLRAFDSIEALAEACDVLDICSSTYSHEPVVVAAATAGKNVIVEKIYTGAFGPPQGEFHGHDAPKEPLLRDAMESCRRIRQAVERSGVSLAYAENWVYAPAVQKEREIIEKTGAQILWLRGEESHSGSHSPSYGIWRRAGGGSLVGKGCHPLTAALYLKRVEGQARGAGPIRPRAVSARTHRLTQLPAFRDAGYLRADYQDVEDYAALHVVFDDGTAADIWSAEIVLGGVYNWLEVCANNHRSRCSINPINAVQTYNPLEKQLAEVYVVEKIGTKQGWSFPAPDEDWMNGYYHELQDFAEAFAFGRPPRSGIELAEDTVAACYAAYVSASRKGAEVDIPRLGAQSPGQAEA